MKKEMSKKQEDLDKKQFTYDNQGDIIFVKNV